MKRVFQFFKNTSSHHNPYELELMEEQLDRRILIWAFVCAVVLHVLIIFVPLQIFGFLKFEKNQEKPFEVQLVTDQEMYEFVETNPSLENQTSREKYVISNRAQRAAQPNPDVNDRSEVPLNERGEKEAHKVVDGSFVRQNQDPQMSQDQSRDAEQSVKQASRDVIERKYPEFLEKPIKPEVFSADGTRVPHEKREALKDKITPKPMEESPYPEENPLTRPNDSQVAVKVMQEEVKTVSQTGVKPKPRKRIQLSPVSGPLKDSQRSASDLGVVSVEAQFSEFGDYLQRMIEAISTQWSLLAVQSHLGVRDWGAHVKVTFKVHRDGTVSDVKLTTNGASELGSVICRDAVLSRAPYGEWTQEMIQMLGEEQVINMGFTYR